MYHAGGPISGSGAVLAPTGMSTGLMYLAVAGFVLLGAGFLLMCLSQNGFQKALALFRR